MSTYCFEEIKRLLGWGRVSLKASGEILKWWEKRRLLCDVFVCFGIFLLVFKFCPQAHAENFNSVFDLMAKSKFSAALSSLRKDHPVLNGEGEYLEGYCLMRLYQPSEAKPHFLKSLQQGYAPYSNWTSTKDFLDRIDRFERLRPIRQSNPYFDIYANNSSWVDPLLKELPKFSERARFIFGSVPKITFFVFAQRSDFNIVFRDLFEYPADNRWWNNGTGVSNLVMFCERNKDGKWALLPGSARAYGDVLHEYGHALCDTIYGDNYLDHVPEWLNEGMADAVAKPYYGDLFLSADNLLRKFAETNRPPQYEYLCHGMYANPSIGYAFGRLMVEELLSGDVRKISAIISASRAAQNFEVGMKTACGKSGKDVYYAVVKKYWKK